MEGRAPGGSEDGGEDVTEIRTFLIADVRGYTLFTHERGDEIAAKLAAKFAGLARTGVEARGGSVIELRGDEALAVFASPRQAIRAAVDLQRRFADETESDPSLPLPVGIGLDAGEAVPVEGGYRGGALNLAARLCGQAGPGEILASQEVTHLARRIEGVIYVDGGQLSLKGLKEPVHVVRVVPEEDDPAKRFAVGAPEPSPSLAQPTEGLPSRRRLTGRPLLVAGIVVLVIAAAIGIPLAVRSASKGLPSIDANAAGTIDPANGHITGQVSLGDIPGGIASGAGSVWVALPASGSVARIDPQTDAVIQKIPVGSNPTSVAFGSDAIWVTNSDSRNVSRIDPAADKSVQTIIVGNAPSALAFGEGFVWVTNTLDGTVSKIDPVSGQVKATISAGATPVGITAGAGSVWVANQASGQVVRIDPATGAVGQTVSVGHGPSGMTFDGNDVWVANSQDGTVSKIDPSTGGVSTTVNTGGSPGQLAAGEGSVWAADAGQNALIRIDPGSGTVTHTTDVDNAPEALAFDADALWVTARGSAASHQGGTLTALTSSQPPGADPNADYGFLAADILTNTNDGLLTYARVGGTAGSALVPDLATTIPSPTDGGTTYTFSLRQGIRYSDGSTVTPEDVRSSFERVYTVGKGPSLYLDPLVGAERCSKAGCDLSQAIVPDDTAWTVTFHLKTPDPVFLDVLGMPSFAIVPSSASSHDTGSHPLPATGPYMIESYTKGKTGEIQLVRNQYFHEWSRAAQPAGYADRIVFRFGVDLERATSQVEQGQADLLLDSPPADTLQEIRTRFSAQSHPFTQLAVDYMFMNTQVPPFDDARVRRALNYAVDRAKMAKSIAPGGLYGADGPVTCQALPPNLPGYAPFCPYTLNRSADGSWSAPVWSKAQHLVKASGTEDTHITVWSPLLFAAQAKYVASVLNKLHYPTTTKVIGDVDSYFHWISDSSNRAQIGVAGWLIDFPAPSNVFAELLTRDAFIPDNPNNENQNYSEFWSPGLDRQIRQAEALETTDPPRANTLWAQIDRQVVGEAPWVPFATPAGTYLVSAKVGNFGYNPVLGVLVGQLWVS
jgi:YVTN family beta-propeller protein